jgi:NTE family protein
MSNTGSQTGSQTGSHAGHADSGSGAHASKHRFGFRAERPRIVLVLGGGGMRGMAHIGVLKAMRQLGIPYDAIVGTSIGALVGAMAAGGYDTDRMESIIGKLQKEDYFRLNVVKFLLKGIRAPSVYRGDTFRQRLTEILPERTFEDLSLPFFCNAVRLETGGSVFWGTPGLGDISLVDAVYSSCCLPGIFEPYERDGYNYMDGGIVDPLPLRFAKTLGPDLIIAIDLTVKATFKAPNYQARVASTLFRAFEIAEEVIVEQGLHMHADYRTALVQPKVGHLARFDFNDVSEVVRLGEEETLRVLSSHAATRLLVIFVCPVAHPCKARHSSTSSGPAAEWMAPSIPPPPSSEEFAAFTIASISSAVMSPR